MRKMFPWWGVLLSCIAFGIWTVLAAMVGASIAINARKPQQKYQKPGLVVPDDISEMEK